MKKTQDEEQYPGYPHYPANEDITDGRNNNGIVRPDASDAPPPPPRNDNAEMNADVTPEDLRLLDAAEQNMDTPDGRNLMASALDDTDMDGDLLNEEGSIANDVSGKDLDIPGSSADDANERIGSEDEENNYYSLGGDLHESQEENKGD